MKYILFALVVALSFWGCQDSSSSDDSSHKSVSLRIKNNTNSEIVVQYDTEKMDAFLNFYLKKTSKSISPLHEISISVYYDVIPDVTITGPGFQKTYNALAYEGDVLVIHQSDLSSVDG
jgi:hypothetical protein